MLKSAAVSHRVQHDEDFFLHEKSIRFPEAYLVCRQSFGKPMGCFVFVAAAWQALVFCQNCFMHSVDFVNTSDFKYGCGVSLL